MPRGKLRSVYSQGYSEAKKQMLESVKLPTKTRCYECNRLKSLSGFSEKQKNDLRNGIATGDVSDPLDYEASWIKCSKCTGGQVTELVCATCDTVKGLDGFAKAQRRNGEHARCLECVAAHLEEKPIQTTATANYIEDLEADSDSDTEYSETNFHEDSTFDGSESGVLLDSSEQGLTVDALESLNVSAGGHNSQRTASASKAATTASLAGENEWQVYSRKNGGNGRSSHATSFNGYDPQGNLRRQVHSPSTVLSDDSNASTTGAPSLDAKAYKIATARFAKLEGPNKPPVKPQVYIGRTVDYDDNDEDDEDDDDEKESPYDW